MSFMSFWGRLPVDTQIIWRAQAHSVVSRMMVEEQLAGSWDQPTRTVVMHNAQPGRLQTLASELSDRAAALVDLNERALQLRTGGPREEDESGGSYGEPGTRVRGSSEPRRWT